MITMSQPSPNQDPTRLSVSQVSKAYGPRQALEQVSLQVAAGEFVALLGPNGAGKSTLFQLLSGLFVADAGEIQVAGIDLARDQVGALAHCGVVFQQPTLDLDLTVRANLMFHARLHGLAQRDALARIEQQVERLDLGEYVDAQARTLSGGYRRKVELARALIHRPAVLLMDEATVGLDPASRGQLLDHVLALRDAHGVGILWATHLVDEAERADRVVILHRGHVLHDATPQAICAATGAHDLATAFLGATGAGVDAPDQQS
jgi:ABC-2 type transport system ATP-binding protein